MGFLEDFERVKNKQTGVVTDQSEVLVEKFMATHEYKLNSLKDLVGSPPAADQIYFLWTVKSFNAFTFIPYIIKEFGRIDELIVSTYAINQRILDSFSRYIRLGKVGQVSILISETLKTRMPAVADQLGIYAKQHQAFFSFGFNWNHSKVSLLRVGQQYFVAEGSGNWSENAKNEQYIFLQSKKVFNFRKQWILEGIGHE